MRKQHWLLTCGGKIRCKRCQATSKRTKIQCAAPACAGKNTCRFHGGLSTGARTHGGRARCVEAKTTHGQSTRLNRLELSQELAQIALLEELARRIGMITGSRPRGRRAGFGKA